MKAVRLIAIFSLDCVWIAAACKHGEDQTSILVTHASPLATDKHLVLFENEDYKFIGVHYGSGFGQPQTPGFFVLSKKTDEWIRIDKVSTCGAIFGRSPSWEECRKAGILPPEIGWDFRRLAEQPYVAMPLTSHGFLFFPHKIEMDTAKKLVVLRFNSDWKLEGVETILRFSADDLAEAFVKKAKDKKTP